MILAHKIALHPTPAQASYFVRARGTARFAYNWALTEWRWPYLAAAKPSEAGLRRQLNARTIADVGRFEFGRQLTCKAAMSGVRIVVADRWFPSSKTCCDCGHVHAELKLSDREGAWEAGGVIDDRHRNAAINLMKFAARFSGEPASSAR
jgi:hypothetical protein